MGALRRLARYCWRAQDCTRSNTITEKEAKDLTLDVYHDTDWAGDPEDYKSTTGIAISLRWAGQCPRA
eukprot:7392105-Alexandrium_andersonii.AAC.1